LAFDVELDKDVVRRILSVYYDPESDSEGPSWLTFRDHMKDSLWSCDLFRCESATLRNALGFRRDGLVHASHCWFWCMGAASLMGRPCAGCSINPVVVTNGTGGLISPEDVQTYLQLTWATPIDLQPM
jgi:hypothetical protein